MKFVLNRKVHHRSTSHSKGLTVVSAANKLIEYFYRRSERKEGFGDPNPSNYRYHIWQALRQRNKAKGGEE